METSVIHMCYVFWQDNSFLIIFWLFNVIFKVKNVNLRSSWRKYHFKQIQIGTRWILLLMWSSLYAKSISYIILMTQGHLQYQTGKVKVEIWKLLFYPMQKLSFYFQCDFYQIQIVITSNRAYVVLYLYLSKITVCYFWPWNWPFDLADDLAPSN